MPLQHDSLTISACRQYLYQHLKQICQSPEHVQTEIFLILEHVLKQSKTYLLAYPEETISREDCLSINHILNQRTTQRVPLQYILKEGWFYGHCFQVSPDVLIPRPETECLIDHAIDILKQNPELNSILDMGTGSGCIAISLALAGATQKEPLQITATDISLKALKLAQKNAQKLLQNTATSPIQFHHQDGLSDLPPHSIDLLLSNPPYIPIDDAPTLQPEVSQHEPHNALFAHDKGLALYKHIASEGHRILTEQGHIVVEFGENSEAVRDIFKKANYPFIQIHPDLSGRPRFLHAAKHALLQ